jgi:hypothetical protein
MATGRIGDVVIRRKGQGRLIRGHKKGFGGDWARMVKQATQRYVSGMRKKKKSPR